MQLECDYPNKPDCITFHGDGFGVQQLSFQAGEKPYYRPDPTKEYAGLPKGLHQILWERGLLVDDMTRDGGSEKTEELSMVKVIMSQPDVEHQKSMLSWPSRLRAISALCCPSFTVR